MSHSNQAEAKVDFKPLQNEEFVVHRALEAFGFTDMRTQSRFVDYHEFIWETRIGKEIFKIDSAETIMTALLWKLWKKTHHASFPITDNMIMNELEVLIGGTYLTEAKENAGAYSVEEFGDSVRYFFIVTKREYYGGIIGSFCKARDSLIGLVMRKYWEKHLNE